MGVTADDSGVEDSVRTSERSDSSVCSAREGENRSELDVSEREGTAGRGRVRWSSVNRTRCGRWNPVGEWGGDERAQHPASLPHG